MTRRILLVVPACVGALLLFNISTSHAQLRDAGRTQKSARVVERGQNHSRWESVVEITDPRTNEKIQRTNSYVQLETGLHYVDERGNWQESSEEIELLTGAAVARKGPHRVQWAANINTYAAITLITPDGEQARSHVLGLAYYDPDIGDSVMIAGIQDSIGGVAGNRVIYENAFDGVKADLRYTYTKAGFVQDVIVRERLPDPVELGFDPETVQLQVLTEFVELPRVTREKFTVPTDQFDLDEEARAALEADELSTDRYSADQKYEIGSMQMGRGRAFELGDEQGGKAARVNKRFEQFEGGRDILVETVEFEEVRIETEKLPERERRTASLNAGQRRLQGPGRRTAPQAPVRQMASLETMIEDGPLLMARAFCFEGSFGEDEVESLFWVSGEPFVFGGHPVVVV